MTLIASCDEAESESTMREVKIYRHHSGGGYTARIISAHDADRRSHNDDFHWNAIYGDNLADLADQELAAIRVFDDEKVQNALRRAFRKALAKAREATSKAANIDAAPATSATTVPQPEPTKALQQSRSTKKRKRTRSRVHRHEVIQEALYPLIVPMPTNVNEGITNYCLYAIAVTVAFYKAQLGIADERGANRIHINVANETGNVVMRLHYGSLIVGPAELPFGITAIPHANLVECLRMFGAAGCAMHWDHNARRDP